jgi:hypothetical protein
LESFYSNLYNVKNKHICIKFKGKKIPWRVVYKKVFANKKARYSLIQKHVKNKRYFIK